MTIDLIESLMQEDASITDQLQQIIDASGADQLQIDEFTIRKLLIRKKYNLKQIEKHKEMFSRIKQEWDQMIQKIEQQNDFINQTVLNFMDMQKEKKLDFDVASVSKRTVKSNIVVENKEQFSAFLTMLNLEKAFLKTDIDYTKAKHNLIEMGYQDVPGCSFIPEHQTISTKFKE